MRSASEVKPWAVICDRKRWTFIPPEKKYLGELPPVVVLTPQQVEDWVPLRFGYALHLCVIQKCIQCLGNYLATQCNFQPISFIGT